MYSDQDLDTAVEKGIFTENAVEQFRHSMATVNSNSEVDEENFRLIGGFNDIFVVLACGLLLFSSLFFLNPINEHLAGFSFMLLAWGLAEFFVLKRKMSLPAIVLLFAFVGGSFSFISALFESMSQLSIMVAAGGATLAAYLHWLRFKVPMTVAAGMFALILITVSSFLKSFPEYASWIFSVVALCGFASFSLAMWWDAADTERVTRKSDVAFWLHLISAPLIIHPVFSTLGVFEGNQSLASMGLVIMLYILMTVISLIIDRRAFMVSSLVYVVYALSAVIQSYGNVSYSFALTGILMGAMLLLLSACWHTVRARIVTLLPNKLSVYIPKVAKV